MEALEPFSPFWVQTRHARVSLAFQKGARVDYPLRVANASLWRLVTDLSLEEGALMAQVELDLYEKR